MKVLRLSVLLIAVFILAFAVSSCAPQPAAPEATQPPATSAPTSAPTMAPTATQAEAATPASTGADLKGDMIRGGKLYDSWWTEIGKDPPKDSNPLFLTQTTDKAKGASTWRCAECHGWDYKGKDGVFASGSHMTGFKGILALMGKDPSMILAALKGQTNPQHDFSKVMAEQDLVDLALFVSAGTMDMDAVLNKDGSPKGVAADGKQKYDQVCAACHGANGNAINFKTPDAVEYLAHTSSSNSWQFLHRMRFGVAVWPMPAAIENKFSDQDLANVLAYARTLPKTGAKASGGGQLYDKWYTVLGVTTPDGDQPLWKKQSTNARKGVSTWTCRECHGIDYLGASGMYASGGHKTGFPGIFGASAKTEDELEAALKGQVNPDHDFSKLLNDAQIDAMVHWIKNEMFDISSKVMPDGVGVAGDKAHGKTIFDQTCAQCHGKDGKLLNFKTPDAPEYVGTVAADEPQVCLHRVAFGVPGFPMSAAIDLGMSVQDIADVCAYSQTLPVK
jgi:mono/diheme cytochrome c family protein